MLKKSIRYPLLFFIITIISQLIFGNEIKLIHNIGTSFIMFLLILLYNWADVPYKWKKEDSNQ